MACYNEATVENAMSVASVLIRLFPNLKCGSLTVQGRTTERPIFIFSKNSSTCEGKEPNMYYRICNYNNPQDRDAKKKFFPAPHYLGTLTTKQFAKRLSHSTTMTEADAMAFLVECANIFEEALINGEKIKLDGIGTFKETFGGIGQEKASDVTADSIRNLRTAFLIDSELRRRIQNEIYFTKAGNLINKTDDENTSVEQREKGD